MVVNRFFARDTADALEREHLGYLCEMADPITTERLRKPGIVRGWRCLEVATGTGSVALKRMCDWLVRTHDDRSFRLVDMTLFGAWGRRRD
jgi:hypothetical protein